MVSTWSTTTRPGEDAKPWRGMGPGMARGLRSRERCRRDTQASTLRRLALARRERTVLKHAEPARRVQRAWPEARSAS